MARSRKRHPLLTGEQWSKIHRLLPRVKMASAEAVFAAMIA